VRRSTQRARADAGPDDVYLGQRGLRTLAVRLKQPLGGGMALAEWIARQAEVERVLHPRSPETARIRARVRHWSLTRFGGRSRSLSNGEPDP